MGGFYITSIAIGPAILVILASVLCVYLLRAKGSPTHTRFLAGYIIAVVILALNYIIRDLWLHPLSALVTYPLASGVILGIAMLVHFSYRFPTTLYPRARRIVPNLYLLVACVALVTDFILAHAKGAVYLPTSHHYSYQSHPFLAVTMFSGFVIAITVFFRKSYRYAGRPGVVSWLIGPLPPNARSAKYFGIVTLGSLIVSLSFVLSVSEMISYTLFNHLFNFGSLIIVLLYFVVYSVASPEYSSVQQKLIGVSMATVLVVLGVCAILLFDAVERRFDDERLRQSKAVVARAFQVPSLALSSGVEYIARVDEVEPGSGYRYRLTRPGEIEWDPSDFRRSDEQLALMPDIPVVERSVQVDRSYRFFDMADPTTFYVTYYVEEAGALFEVGYSYVNLRRALHEFGLMAYLAIAAAGVVVLVVYPLFFRWSITRPLRALETGVRAVENGSLGSRVPVFAQDELGYISKAFNDMVDAVRRADELKDSFLANTSHELRTPLNGIIGLAEGLVDGAQGKLSEGAARDLTLVIASGRRLLSLVNDILDFSKIKQQDLVLTRKPVDLRRLVDLVLRLSQPLVAGRAVKLVNSVPVDLSAVMADERRIEQILHNLVGNAIKFTEVGTIEVVAEESGAWIRVAVKDSGVGIPQESRERVFEAFDQGSGEQASGTGLGLAITKQLVELHGGELSLESTVGEGTTVFFSLPRSEVEAEISQRSGELPGLLEEIRSESISQNRGGLRVLVVDDDEINLRVLTSQLSAGEFQVDIARNGEEAIRRVAETTPDIVLLDVMMPVMNGYEACQRIRVAHLASELPVIMLTAKSQTEDIVAGLDSGANDYVVKPFFREELLARIRTHLQLSKINIAYGRFVPHAFLQILRKESIVDIRRGDHVSDRMTVMFSDIRDFTAFSESMDPTQVLEFVNGYLERIVPVVQMEGGIIDKFIGDAIMALFPDHPRDAVTAGVGIQRQIALLNAERIEQSLEPIAAGVGIHAGDLIVGTVGAEERMQQTVLSDAVNLASRIESLTKRFGAPVLVSESVYQAVENDGFEVRTFGRIRVKGKQTSTEIFELLDGNSESQRVLKVQTREDFEDALELYYAKRFDEALAGFSRVLRANPEDLAAKHFRDKCAGYVLHPPTDDWLTVDHDSDKT